MPYINRVDGKITGVFMREQYKGQGFINDYTAEYLAYKAGMQKEADNRDAKANLEMIDSKSIRSIREWLIKQADCPEFLKEHDKQAGEERAKLK